MKKSQLKQLIREEIKSIMDKYPFNQSDDYYNDDNEEENTEIGDIEFESENYYIKKHPHRPGKFYVTNTEGIVKCIGTYEKCMYYIQKEL